MTLYIPTSNVWVIWLLCIFSAFDVVALYFTLWYLCIWQNQLVESFGDTYYLYFLFHCAVPVALPTTYCVACCSFTLCPFTEQCKLSDFILQYWLDHFNVHLHSRINKCINYIYTCPSWLMPHYNLYKNFQLFIGKIYRKAANCCMLTFYSVYLKYSFIC